MCNGWGLRFVVAWRDGWSKADRVDGEETAEMSCRPGTGSCVAALEELPEVVLMAVVEKMVVSCCSSNVFGWSGVLEEGGGASLGVWPAEGRPRSKTAGKAVNIVETNRRKGRKEGYVGAAAKNLALTSFCSYELYGAHT